MRYIYLSFICIMMSVVSVYPQTTIYSNFGSGNSYNTTTGLAILNTQIVAAKFTVGSPGYSDITVTVALQSLSNGNFNLALYNDNGANLPTGSPIANTTVPVIGPATSIQSVNFSSLSLSSGDYDIVISPGSVTSGGWNNNTLGIKGCSFSTNSGSSWSYNAGQIMPVFKVVGNNVLPVELTSFSAKLSGSNIELTWQTATEVNNYGFEVERRSQEPGVRSQNNPESEWRSAGFVRGNGNSNSLKEYSFVDKDILQGNYLYRLKQIDNDGQFEYSKTVAASLMKPEKFILEQNYPNPFNPSTTISYSIPKNSKVKLIVYNLLGQAVRTLVDEVKAAGTNKVEFHSEGLSSGIYFYKLEADGVAISKKMTILK